MAMKDGGVNLLSVRNAKRVQTHDVDLFLGQEPVKQLYSAPEM